MMRYLIFYDSEVISWVKLHFQDFGSFIFEALALLLGGRASDALLNSFDELLKGYVEQTSSVITRDIDQIAPARAS